MIVATLDTSVVAAGIGWAGGPARRVLRLLARRCFFSCRTLDLSAEWAETVERLAREEARWKNPNWEEWLDWCRRKSQLVDPVPLKPTVKRDPDDDVVLAAALGSHASYLVSYDPHLLGLQKPYGIAIVRPQAFLSAVISTP